MKFPPSSFTRNISPCYRTLLHQRDGSLERMNYVFGDRFSEGFGDEFFSNDEEHGIFNKLGDPGSLELIFGRGGYGNIGTLVEFKQYYQLLEKYTSLDTTLTERYHVTYVFKWNGLNNNLVEESREVNETKYKLRFFLLLFEFAYRKMRGIPLRAYWKIKVG